MQALLRRVDVTSSDTAPTGRVPGPVAMRRGRTALRPEPTPTLRSSSNRSQHFQTAVADLSLPPEFSMDGMGEFIDWDRDGLYVLERGEGECAI